MSLKRFDNRLVSVGSQANPALEGFRDRFQPLSRSARDPRRCCDISRSPLVSLDQVIADPILCHLVCTLTLGDL